MGNDIESFLMPNEIKVAEFEFQMNFIASDGRSFTDYGLFYEYESELRAERQRIIESPETGPWKWVSIPVIIFILFLAIFYSN